MSYTMSMVPVKRYIIYPTSSMYVVSDEPYFNIDDSVLRDYFDTSYNLNKGYDELWYYIQSKNVIMLKEYCGKKNMILVNCMGIRNLLLYSNMYKFEPFEDMLRYGESYKARSADGIWEEDADLTRWCDVVYDCFTVPRIPYEKDKDYIQMFDYHTACCVYVRDILKLFSERYNMVNMVTYGILSKYAIIYYDYRKNDFTAIIQFTRIKAFLIELGISKTDLLPLWRKIVNCYKVYVGANYGK